ncbi:MAG TPA: GntR family transcriptional regulator [Acidimicrobiia bacterium]|jgi:DNA-binding GntR family transcriptional regulator
MTTEREMPEPPSIDQIARTARSNYRTVEEMVVAAIREAVLSGVYGPGDKLPQEKLAQALGASRIPVRAALRQLEAEGLVVFSPHRGATVRTLEPADVEEIYELRILLETFALRSAIDEITSTEVDELEAIAEDLDRLAEGEEWLRLREHFYSRLYAIARKPLTTELITKLRADVGRYWLSLRLSDHASGGHRVIVDAMRQRDPEAAERWLAKHLEEVSTELQLRVAERLQE